MTGENVLIVGSGGREHALAEMFSASDDVSKVTVAPGNPGLHNPERKIFALPSLSEDDDGGIASYAQAKNALVVVGPEKPLANGIADFLRNQGVTVFGPSAEAAKLEASKSFAVQRMREGNVKHPESYLLPNAEEARVYAAHHSYDTYVIKEDGLAGGKGVYLPKGDEEANQIIEHLVESDIDFLFQERFKLKDDTGNRLEFSAFAVCDGKNFLLLPFAQDHKALYNGDEGPNTGGMGAYCPIPMQTPELSALVADKIVEPTLHVMRERGTPFRGLLYVGGIKSEEFDGEPAVIEFNVRFGDPETQVVLPQLRAHDIDGYDLLRTAAEGKLEQSHTGILAPAIGTAAVTACMATEGYPVKAVTGDIIHGTDVQRENITIHFAGVKQNEAGQLETSSGRALYVTARDANITHARERVYDAINDEDGINFRANHFRTDIAEYIA